VKILVLNCGSSSVKFKFFETEGYRVLARGEADRIGMPGATLSYEARGIETTRIERPLKDHRAAVGFLLSLLANEPTAVLKGLEEIDGVGHRIVHGGEHFRASILIEKGKRALLETCGDLAPLHHPPNLAGIDICADLLPGILQAAVFDTAFHQTIPDFACTYAVPYRYYEEHRIRKYGFHGISHQYVASRAAEILRTDLAALKMVTCHLGAGCSLCAVGGGKSLDTSMGFTPLAGLVMATRSGDIDPALVAFIAAKEKLSADAVIDILNQQSGVLGVSGLSKDFRDLERAALDGHERAGLALTIFAYSAARGIGSMIPAIGGLDTLVFTAGIGENSPIMRSRIAAHLSWLGIDLDEEKNAAGKPDSDISTIGSPVRVMIIPTNEELMIAKETVKLLNGI
jgi:acetate kinase